MIIIRALWKEAVTLRNGCQRLQTPKQKQSEQSYFESIDNHCCPHHVFLECGNKSERFNLFLPCNRSEKEFVHKLNAHLSQRA